MSRQQYSSWEEDAMLIETSGGLHDLWAQLPYFLYLERLLSSVSLQKTYTDYNIVHAVCYAYGGSIARSAFRRVLFHLPKDQRKL